MSEPQNKTTAAPTAAPWDAKLNKTGSCYIVRGAEQVKRGGGHVCQVDMWSHGDISFPNSAEAEANARLIAAAPEMLEALRQARGALLIDCMVDDAGKPYGTTAVALDMIVAAIAKAEG